ncbi:hypothetical protein EG329_000987 [Mollisiaceae sp. DMI_Dod_QoI]|nr:hypothetical protein EG329_000987 [Helotiales sp. DMI_Dod_QoI]
MSAWCDVWYETQDYQVAYDSFSLRLSQIPQQILAFRFESQDTSGRPELIPFSGCFVGPPSMAKLESNAPGFERISQAFDNLHGISHTSTITAVLKNKNNSIPSSVETNQMSRISESATPAIVPFSPVDIDLPLKLKQTSIQPRSFTIHKRTAKEKSASLDRLKLSNYVRDFNVEWNDIDDILQYEFIGKNKLKNITKFMVKGKDWSWRWLPAECVNSDLIEEYLKERDENNSDAKERKTSESPTPSEFSKENLAEDLMVVYTVRQGPKYGYPFRRVLDIARFVDLEEANKCAEHHFKNQCTPDTMSTWKRYRFGDRFFGSVANNQWIDEDIMIWVEKETRSAAGLVDTNRSIRLSKSSAKNATDALPDFEISPDPLWAMVLFQNQGHEYSEARIPPIDERVRDSRDFFENVGAKKRHTDAGPISGSLRKREPLDPFHYFGDLEKRRYQEFLEWKRGWWKNDRASSERKVHKATIKTFESRPATKYTVSKAASDHEADIQTGDKRSSQNWSEEENDAVQYAREDSKGEKAGIDGNEGSRKIEESEREVLERQIANDELSEDSETGEMGVILTPSSSVWGDDGSSGDTEDYYPGIICTPSSGVSE